MKGFKIFYKKYKSEILLLITFICLLIHVVYFTMAWTLLSGREFDITGHIGDTIGGITAPFINLLGAYWVYRSFKVQTEANKKQFGILEKQLNQSREDKDIDMILSLFNSIKEDLKDLEYKEYRGKSALNVFVRETCIKSDTGSIDKMCLSPIHSQFKFILGQYSLIIHKITYSNTEQKQYLIILCLNFFNSIISNPSVGLYKHLKKHGCKDNFSLILEDIHERHKEFHKSLKKSTSPQSPPTGE